MNLNPLFSKLYPDNSVQGECGVFAHRLVDFPSVGNTYASKKRAVDLYGIRASQLNGDIRIGDVVITSEGTFMGMGAGHVAVVNNIYERFLTLTESNFKKDGRVHHGRSIEKTSPKIYGVIRGKFKFPLPTEMVLNVSVFMNHPKDLPNSLFVELSDWFNKNSKGKIRLNLIPLNTYKSLKNWWYRAYGTFDGHFYNVIDRGFFEEQAMPLRYPNTHIVLWAITKDQWQGSVFDSTAKELGWYYPVSNPGEMTITCDADDVSFLYPEKAFVHYARHEIFHFLYCYGNRRGLDLTHKHDLSEKNLALGFDELEYDYLFANL